ncbi:SPFH domain-containing protein [Brevundimonas sp.]|uniref:SPFH domain-containing protein n=1 Tax=Brevundimonas sp. TaxID=1871086 RepID=UPI002487D499|nr:SPFH domain-containing protein [Brevundimonas sp.]MDI1282727.1 SPFH domain-containing protein [Brevundimonas sp.]
MNIYIVAGGVALGVLAIGLLIAVVLRRVVPTNEVHIVQRGRSRVSYGASQSAGNVFYEWPAFLPRIGVLVTKFPVSIFDVNLKDYEAYDTGRLPFRVDVQAFMRIAESDTAAEKVANFDELQHQLSGILQGAVRNVLATHKLEDILEARSTLAEAFTAQVDHQLQAWGVETVKNIEFMDIRDSANSQVIANIMAKEKSRIDRESREAVAMNSQFAQTKEIEAERIVEVNKQDALQQVGMRTAEQEKQVGIAKQVAEQEVLVAQKDTTEREMDVKLVADTRAADIAKGVAEVQAAQEREVTIIRAEGQRQQQVIGAEAERQRLELVAQGTLAQQKLDAEGLLAQGQSRAEAERLLLLAPVTTQIELAREIGNNDGYQTYLVRVEQIKAGQAVGVAQAEALSAADIKVIVTGGDVPAGMNSITDVFSARGGQALGAMLEGLAQTDAGKAVVERATKGAAKPKE